jgi:hypothetical protein
MRIKALIVLAVVVSLTGCIPKPTAADAERVVKQVLADVNGVSPREVVMDRPIDRPPLISDTDDMMDAVSILQRRFGISLTDKSVMNIVGADDIEEVPSRLTPDHLVRLVKLALHEQKKN